MGSIDGYVFTHSPPPPPQSLLYDKYINDCTKSGEIHLKAIEI